jgi:membrane associated rhomboid family serine protease
MASAPQPKLPKRRQSLALPVRMPNGQRMAWWQLIMFTIFGLYALSAALTLALDDPYATLGVSRGATAREIKKAYHRLALKVHPDKRIASDADMTFRSVVEAYELLSDPELRAEYDEAPVLTRFAELISIPSPTVLRMGMLESNAGILSCLNGGTGSPLAGVNTFDKVRSAWRCLRAPKERREGPKTTSNVHWWQTITASFLHFNGIHLLFNSWRLWRFGQSVENRLGQRAFVATFVLGGAIGNVLFSLLDGRSHVGATASIFALQGAAFADHRETTGRWLNRENLQLIGSFAFEVFVIRMCELFFEEIMDGLALSFWGHVGGFLGGLCVMEMILELRHRTKSEWSTYSVAAVCLGALAIASSHLLSNLTSSGPWMLLSGLYPW